MNASYHNKNSSSCQILDGMMRSILFNHMIDVILGRHMGFMNALHSLSETMRKRMGFILSIKCGRLIDEYYPA